MYDRALLDYCPVAHLERRIVDVVSSLVLGRKPYSTIILTHPKIQLSDAALRKLEWEADEIILIGSWMLRDHEVKSWKEAQKLFPPLQTLVGVDQTVNPGLKKLDQATHSM